ncbi:hypothetical protein [Actinoplanes solisilvae]|uniref:hypothetical protein n=1 Tax=Actinoplanes solisilvae TaxID=2486853 RepID=UPI000FD6EF9C|nr:hypothetical protein [Actinoplanes solisilvae]
MNLLSIKLLGSLAVAGMVAAGGTAFTASGVDLGVVSSSQVVGVGSVEQTVTGATVESIVYGTTGGLVDNVTVTFVDPLQAGAIVTLNDDLTAPVSLAAPLNAPTSSDDIYSFGLTTPTATLASISIVISS